MSSVEFFSGVQQHVHSQFLELILLIERSVHEVRSLSGVRLVIEY